MVIIAIRFVLVIIIVIKRFVMSYLSVNPAKAAFSFSAQPRDDLVPQQQQQPPPQPLLRSLTASTSTTSLSTQNVAATTVALLDVVDDLKIIWLIFLSLKQKKFLTFVYFVFWEPRSFFCNLSQSSNQK